MSFRLAAYGVCVEDGRVLLGRHVSSDGRSTWTLPGGGVEHAEDPVDTVVREVAEETGYDAVVERLLGVDSRVIPAAEARRGRGTRTSASSLPPARHRRPASARAGRRDRGGGLDPAR
ncbi:NUDIX hydrolase [Streptomyces albus]